MHKQAMEMAKWAMCDAHAKGYDCMTSQDWDDLKDCVEAAEKAIKADYYYMMVCAMKEEEEYEKQEEKWLLKELKEKHGMSEEDSRRFYDAWRYKSSGRFAPRGKGERYGRRGYEEPPYMHIQEDYRMDLADYKGKTAEEMRDMDRHTKGVMYYTEPVRMDGMREMHDRKDGKSWEKRRGYMETKELHKDGSPESKQHRMKDLEMYAKDLTEDVVDMISDASPEERALLKQKMQVLIQKIG